jgi:2-amino-4-hydroxy-6-hydroxymethyldihydropteridine diphosphokinase
MTRAFVGFGSNLGDRTATVHRAIDAIRAIEGVSLVAISSIRETEPVGYLDQPMFLNGAIEVETTLTARELLDELLDVERSLGRTRTGPQYGPRSIDLDLLLFGDLVVDARGLTVPHPRLHERLFVVQPLAELDPELVVPERGRIVDLLAALADP